MKNVFWSNPFPSLSSPTSAQHSLSPPNCVYSFYNPLSPLSDASMYVGLSTGPWAEENILSLSMYLKIVAQV